MHSFIENAMYDMLALYKLHVIFGLLGYALFFFIASSVGVPGLRVFIVIAGGVMGPMTAIAVSSLAGAGGMIAGYYVGSYVIRRYVGNRYREALLECRRRIEEDGLYYLFALRASPVVPNIMTSLIFGALRYPAPWTFLWISCVAVIPSIAIHAFIGYLIFDGVAVSSTFYTRLTIVLTFVAVMPLIIRKLLKYVEMRLGKSSGE